ncbi:unnamed protein product, partial [Symbiodinium necroappetens]
LVQKDLESYTGHGSNCTGPLPKPRQRTLPGALLISMVRTVQQLRCCGTQVPISQHQKLAAAASSPWGSFFEHHCP